MFGGTLIAAALSAASFSGAPFGSLVGSAARRSYVLPGHSGRNARRLKRRAHHRAKMANIRRARAHGR